MGSGEGTVDYTELFLDPRLLTIVLISFTGTTSIFVISPVFPAMVSGLDGITSENVGLVISAYAIPGIVLVPIVAAGTDLVGRRAVLLPSLALFGIGGTAIAFVDSFSAILALRALQGVGGGALIGTAITLIGDIYSGATGSSAQGFRLSANGLSSIVNPAIGGFLAGISWHLPFLVYAMAFPTLLLAIVYVPEPIDRPENVSIWNRLRAARREISSYASGLRVELTDVNLTLILAGGFFQGFSYFAILTFVPLFAVESLRTSVLVAGAVLSARGVARILIAPFAGSLLTYMSRKQAFIATSGFLAISIGGVGIAPSVEWLVFAIGIFGVGDSLFTPVHRDALTQLAKKENRAGVVNGHSLLRNIATTTSPAFFGIVLGFAGYPTLFLLAAGVFVVYALLVSIYYR